MKPQVDAIWTTKKHVVWCYYLYPWSEFREVDCIDFHTEAVW